jgi:hypothetical protein
MKNLKNMVRVIIFFKGKKLGMHVEVPGYLVAGVALGDGHVRHEVSVEGVPHRWGPLTDDHLHHQQYRNQY